MNSALVAILAGSLITGSRALGLRATATLATAQIAAQTCATEAISVPGAVAGADCIVGAPATLEGGLVETCIVTAAGSVTLRTCNVTASPITPVGSQAVAVRVFNP